MLAAVAGASAHPSSLLWGTPEVTLGLLTRATPRPIANQVVKAAMTGEYTVYLKADGTLWGAGRNDSGQTAAYGSTTDHSFPWQLASGVVDFAALDRQTVFLKSDGSFWLLGGDPESLVSAPVVTPLQIGSSVTAFVMTYSGVFWITSGGTIGERAMNFGTGAGGNTYTLGGLGGSVTSLAAGNNTWYFVKSDGTLWCLGENNFGQLGDGTLSNRTTPVQIPVASVARAFAAAGSRHAVFLKQDGTLWGMGRNNLGQLGDGTTTDRAVPGLIATGVTEVRLENEATYFIKADGTLWGTGSGIYAQADGTTANRSSPTLVADAILDYRSGMLLKTDGTLWAKGVNNYGQLGDGTYTARPAPVQVASGVQSVTKAMGCMAYINTRGELWTAGSNSRGQLGDGAQKPEYILLGTDAVAVDMGFDSGLYTRADGTLWSTYEGQIAGVTSVVAVKIAEFGASRAFLKSDGTLWHLGYDGVIAQMASDVTSFTLGGSFATYVKSDGTLWVMKTPSYESGPTWLNVSSGPVQISSSVTSVTAGHDHLLYIKTDQTLWGMGTQYGGWGQYEPGAVAISPVPVASGVSAVSASLSRNLYVQTDGVLKVRSWDWGDDFGDVYTGSNGVLFGAAGKQYSYYVKTDGTLWRTWGDPPWWGGTEQVGSATTAVSTGSDGGVMIVQIPGTGQAPGINTHPQPVQVVYGRESVLSVGAIGDGPLDYEWFKDDVPITEARSAQYVIPYATPGDAGAYRVKVTNHNGHTYSNVATVTVATPLVITTQPADQLVNDGSTAHFSVQTESGAPLTYQWQIKLRGDSSWSNLSDATGIQGSAAQFFSITASLARHGAQFRCVVTNIAGSMTSSPAKLVVRQAVTAAVSGSARTVLTMGQAVAFTTTASSAIGAPLSYQWKKGNRPIAEATTATLALDNFSPDDAGPYVLEVSDPYGGIVRLTRFIVPDFGPTQVIGWGANGSNQLSAPLALNNAIAVAAGSAHSAALKPDGSLQIWGASSQGQQPGGTTSEVVAVRAYGNRTIALRSSGGVMMWGSGTSASGLSDVIAMAIGSENYFLLRNDGTTYAARFDSSAYPASPASFADVAGIAAGGLHLLVCKLDGTVAAWGADSHGQATVPGALTGVTAVAAGARHSLALKADGTVVAWGDNEFGQATVPGSLTGVVAIEAGEYTSLARRSDGSVVIWGRNTSGETAVPDGLGTFLAVAGGGQHSLGLRASNGDAMPSISTQPASQQHAVGEPVALTVTAAGGAPLHYQWRRNGTNVAGATSATLNFASVTAQQGGYYDVVVSNHVGSVTSATAVLSVVGADVPPFVTEAPVPRQVGMPGQPLELAVNAVSANLPLGYQWKRNNRLIAGATSATYQIANFTNAAAGAYTVEITDGLGLKTYSTSFVQPYYALTQVKAWGSVFQDLPTGLDDLVALTPGPVALNADGTVIAWDNGSFGLNTIPAAATNVAALSANGSYALALRADGTVVTWGNFIPGNLAVPDSLTGVIAGSMGGGHALALKADGTVVAWGSNAHLQAAVPGGLANVVQVAAGNIHSLALKLDGTVVAWGNNSYGQASVPAGLTGVVQVAAGASTSFALKDDGTNVAWGLADWSNQTTVPSGANPATAIAAGSEHVVALKPDATIVSWGANTYGQQNIPADITDVVQAVASGGGTLVLRDASNDAVPQITVHPGSVLRAIGDNLTLTVTAAGAGPFTYQWRKAGTPLAGETGPTLLLGDLQLVDGGSYDVVVSNHVGDTPSHPAVVTVQAPPAITSAPAHLLVGTPGQPLSLEVTATSANAPLTYQWRKNNRLIAEATSPTYTLPAFVNADAGTYTLEITDSQGLKKWFLCFVQPYRNQTQLVGWGLDNHGQASPPPGPAYVAAAGFPGRSFGLTREGHVIGFGTSLLPHGLTDVVAMANGIVLNSDGTLAPWDPDAPHFYHFPLPPGLRDVVSVKTGDDWALALKADGTVVAWGYDAYGQLDMPDGLSDIVQIAAGDHHGLALKADGTVAIWGSNGFSPGPVPNSLTDIVAISAGDNHSTLLKSNGQVLYAYGGAVADYDNPPIGPTTGIAIVSGEDHNLALTPSGGVVGWGDNWFGQTTVPTAAGSGVLAIFAGHSQSFALRDASGDAAPSITSQPASLLRTVGQAAAFTVSVSGQGPFTYQWRKGTSNIAGATGATFNIASLSASDAGSYDVVVTNHIGAVTSGAATLTIASLPAVTGLSPTRNILAPGEALNLSVTASSAGTTTYQWLHNGRPIAGATDASYSVPGVIFENAGWYAVDITNLAGTTRSAPMFATVAPARTQVVFWGQNDDGKLTVPSGLDDAVAIATGGGNEYGHRRALALKRDGTVVAWGNNLTNAYAVPEGLSGVVAIATAREHSLALKSDGTVAAWGNTTHGQTSVPSGLSNVVAIAANHLHSAALKADGTVVVWGDNNNWVPSTLPRDLSNVLRLTTGSVHGLALTSQGTITAWGNDTYGQISGVPTDDDIVAISANSVHSLALKGDGTVLAWGDNATGQADVPEGLTNVAGISAGYYHSLVLKTDGTVTGWGFNIRQVATPPAGLAGVFALSASYNFSLALRNATGDVAPGISGQPISQSADGGMNVAFTITSSGDAPLVYRWQMGTGETWQDMYDGEEWWGAATDTLTIANWAVTALNGIQFRCIVTNGAGTATSRAALLTIPSADSDFTGDGQSDILFQNSVDGRAGLWRMNGTTPNLWIDLPPSSPAWKIVGTGDLTGDGQSDVIFQNSEDGRAGLWRMNGTTPNLWIDLPPSSTVWKIVGTADLTGDGQCDVIFQNASDGRAGLWRMNGTTPTLWINLPPSAPAWKMVGAGDFTGDGQSDILFQNSDDGRAGLWRMNGTAPNLWIDLPPSSPAWKIVGTGDFTGDGQSDVIFQNATDGRAGLWRMNGTTPTLWIDLPASSIHWKIVNR